MECVVVGEQVSEGPGLSPTSMEARVWELVRNWSMEAGFCDILSS